MYVTRVSEAMVRASKVVSLPKTATVAEVRDIVTSCDEGKITHNAFPVVDSRAFPRLRGILELDDLKSALSGIPDADSKSDSRIKLLDWADRSPITVVSHATVARAYEIFRKLGMRHLCVVDNSGMLAGVLTRKDLMTYKLDDSVRMLKARAVLSGWVVRSRLLRHRDPSIGVELSQELMDTADNVTAARIRRQQSRRATETGC